MARSPATYVVPAGDQGGQITFGSVHSGTILRGDLDQWSFSAVKGQVVKVTVNETGTNTAFVPMIQIIGPDGTNYGYAWGDVTAFRQITANTTGVYKVVVSRNDSSDGIGDYSLVIN